VTNAFCRIVLIIDLDVALDGIGQMLKESKCVVRSILATRPLKRSIGGVFFAVSSVDGTVEKSHIQGFFYCFRTLVQNYAL